MRTYKATVTYEVRARDMATAQKKAAKIKGRKDIKVVKTTVSGGWKV